MKQNHWLAYFNYIVPSDFIGRSSRLRMEEAKGKGREREREGEP